MGVQVFNKRGSRQIGAVLIPLAYTVSADDPELPYTVEIDVDNAGPAPRIAAVVCMARPGESIDGRSMRRLSVTDLVREAAATLHVVAVPLGNVTAPPSGPTHEHYLRQRGHRRITDDDLRRVTDTYRTALTSGDSPVEAVQRALRLRTRAQAGRWVSKARLAGFLGPAPGLRQRGELTTPEATPRGPAPLPNRSTAPRPEPLH